MYALSWTIFSATSKSKQQDVICERMWHCHKSFSNDSHAFPSAIPKRCRCASSLVWTVMTPIILLNLSKLLFFFWFRFPHRIVTVQETNPASHNQQQILILSLVGSALNHFCYIRSVLGLLLNSDSSNWFNLDFVFEISQAVIYTCVKILFMFCTWATRFKNFRDWFIMWIESVGSLFIIFFNKI